MDPERLTDVFDAWERARAISGAAPPSVFVQVNAFEAAAAIGARFEYRLVLDEAGNMVYEAGVRTERGEAWVKVTTTWEDAIRELGLS